MPTPANAASSIEATTALLREELPQLEQHQQALEKDLAAVTERLESVRGALTALEALSIAAVPTPRVEAEARTGEPVAPAPAAPAAEPVPAEEPAPAPEAEAASEPAPVTEPESEAAPEPAATPDVPAQRTPRSAAPARKAASAAKKPARPASRAKSAKPAAKSRPARKTSAVKATKTAKSTARSTSTAKTTKAKNVQKAEKTTDQAPSPAPQNTGLTEQVAAVLARNGDTPLRARDVAKELGRDDSTGAINTVRSTLDRLVATSRARRAGRGLYQAPAS